MAWAVERVLPSSGTRHEPVNSPAVRKPAASLENPDPTLLLPATSSPKRDLLESPCGVYGLTPCRLVFSSPARTCKTRYGKNPDPLGAELSGWQRLRSPGTCAAPPRSASNGKPGAPRGELKLLRAGPGGPLQVNRRLADYCL
ncbi:hypothetical protein IMZ48_12015 [Candidatus Bathyarchaeota archaeon]|nr:hypothetical protein [Candidatus Bathyarchaeota archaeon]